jgi:pimeloyl-ACP methyl ester carboxylesterase
MESATIHANGLDISFLAEGPSDGPLALCLHGFPDTAHTWRYLLPQLASAGYRAVAPFLRGYAPTSVPSDLQVDLGTLALDACALHEALGGNGDAVLVGHDWGAMIAYGASAHEPDRWRKVVTAAVPPQRSMGERFFTFDQLRRSWYMFFFQTPLAEFAVGMDNYAFIDGLWRTWSPGYDFAWDTAEVKKSLGTPENLAAAIGYYRSMLTGPSDDPVAAAAQAAGDTTAPQPTLYLHGADDGCLGVDIIGPVADFLAPGSAVEIIGDAGHFLQVEQPERVGRLILDFLSN